MKTEKNILIAFILNLAFSIFELFGGVLTGSVAIISDAIHDFGDALSIGISFFLEKKSKRIPDKEYTYGYTRYSVLGGLITSIILIMGSIFVIINSISHILHPSPVNYDGMIIFAVIGVAINFIAARITHGGDSLNEKAVNLHMLEDVMGWGVVLIGAIAMKFTNFSLIDPVMSIGVATYIFLNAMKNLQEILSLFLEKTPHMVNIEEITSNIIEINGVKDVHHVHVWSLDEKNHCATLHIVTNEDFCEVKKKVRGMLRESGISHVTIEVENEHEHCREEHCLLQLEHSATHHSHHHYHH